MNEPQSCTQCLALIIFAEQQAWDVDDPDIVHEAVMALFESSTEEQAWQILAQMTKKQGAAIQHA